ncbi:MAG: hypothetical protein KBT77_04895 [Thalassolituus oleivorans]|uniref:hypothetical protein n=1 Tax=Thalassolituus oleivorans TaxID=187493 RepID=UPI001B78C01C|nr:hypothetical protein [Thalassolituus oleivorans]MBQ0726671.1 hypothetical protein [Thalassolituus oleivorans]MBQ0780229.1 hypothetical protein [Thalassolituus oleivorans]
MTNSDSMRAYMASHIINLLPGLVKEELLSDSKLLKELAIETDVTISFVDKDVAFSRSALFKAIRSAFENTEGKFYLEDVNGNPWALRNLPGERPAFSLTKGDVQILNDSFWPLCTDVDRRLSLFETEAKDGSLSKRELEHWRAVLSVPTISDDDVSDLLLDLDYSPSHIEALMRQEFQGTSNKVSTLVPDNLRYYERLVGKYCGSNNIDGYCKVELKQYFDSRIESGVTENDFLICIHKSISAVVSNGLIDEASYQSIAKRAIETCHPILLISCLEVGMLKFKGSSAAIIKKLFECISSAKTFDNLRLFCSMAVFVDGELARLQIFRGVPPFYRRLASFAQSALIVKVALEEGVAFDKVEQWSSQQRGLYFFCQNFIDLIEEPRWLPTYLTAEQFINELYRRVNVACQEPCKCETVEYLQKELTSGSRLKMYSFLPGPLEGNSAPAVVPDEISNLLAKHINGEASFESYRVLMNSAPFWKIDDDYLERAVNLLESAQHKLAAVNDKDSVYQVLNGLAQVACMTRSKKLAASLTILSRLYRDYIDVDSEPENYLAIGLVAGAAFEDKEGWAEYIGQWCTELAYLKIGEDAIERIELMLERLCILEPYLYYTCSKALDILRMLSGK